MTAVQNDIRARIKAWHEERFPKATPSVVLNKLMEEVGELSSAYGGTLPDDVMTGSGNPPAEAADVLINLVVLEERWPEIFGGVWPEVKAKIAVLEDKASDHRSSMGGRS